MSYPEFEVHKLNAGGLAVAQKLAFVFNEALGQILSLTGEHGREVAIVKTKLEEACFFAKKAIAKELRNQEGG